MSVATVNNLRVNNTSASVATIILVLQGDGAAHAQARTVPPGANWTLTHQGANITGPEAGDEFTVCVTFHATGMQSDPDPTVLTYDPEATLRAVYIVGGSPGAPTVTYFGTEDA